MTAMSGVRLPGDRTVEHVEAEVPTPGHGQVLLRMRASSICGSDIRAIYREHLGTGPEAYQGVIAGHEPCGEVVEVGPSCRRLRPGDRVVVYHIAGCGQCQECATGYLIGCTSPLRAAYGWQRDGGHAEYLLAEEATCLVLPEPLTPVDGALVSCGFGTAYEGLLRLGLSGRDRLLVTGLGPVGLAAAMLGRRFSILTMWQRWVPLYEKTMAEYGTRHFCASIRPIDVRPDQEQLLAGKEEVVFGKLEEQGRIAIEQDGADVLLIGSTTMHQSHAHLTENLPVPVINPGPLTYALAEMLLGVRLSQSRTAYPRPNVFKPDMIHAMLEGAAGSPDA